jgi:GT2 family glycosyltransferase
MLKVAVIIATKGRADVVRALLAELRRQTSLPDTLIVSASEPADVAQASETNPDTQVIFGPPGAARQRNAGLAAMPAWIDVVAFFDDDFIPSRYWIQQARNIFSQHRDIAVATGNVLADGIKTAGLQWAKGHQIVERADDSTNRQAITFKENFLPYGCNMVFRKDAIADIKFDERLVLQSWQEDTDFGARVARNGRAVWTDGLWGVHLGIKGGRAPGRRLGYSQIVNPRYLVAKGTMSPQSALRLAAKNVAANTLLSLYPEPYIDRAGRLQGNLLGLWDIVTGRWYPERAADL